jgi:hypothetical protein
MASWPGNIFQSLEPATQTACYHTKHNTVYAKNNKPAKSLKHFKTYMYILHSNSRQFFILYLENKRGGGEGTLLSTYIHAVPQTDNIHL